ncbi:hypothetical protein [Pseudomonas antarctica]|uniref:hypothetical protein n=1 Tax=Pseudomonas antarctica TaxID=219572 RepID=UPI003F74F8BC
MTCDAGTSVHQAKPVDAIAGMVGSKNLFFPGRIAVFLMYEDQLWERACSRMRCISQQIHQLTHRLREQARSHSFDRVQLS